jgi:hypothetical protein
MEVMRGHTPDISMFRFRFWEPVWYFEPTAKYPKPNFLPGRFVGIAWEHGDAFTYKIWTTPGKSIPNGNENLFINDRLASSPFKFTKTLCNGKN